MRFALANAVSNEALTLRKPFLPSKNAAFDKYRFNPGKRLAIQNIVSTGRSGSP
jgi:hypothetical protein